MSIDVQTVVYVWAVDGIPTLFVSNDDLDDAWAQAQGFASAHPGLREPSSLPLAANLRSLYPQPTSANIEVHDVLGTLPELFGATDDDAEDLVFSLAPDEVPGASLWGKHVGLENIGAAGQRRRYSCVPGYAVGLEHFGSVEAFANDSDATPVSDRPVVWVGRRCAVYRVLYDEAAGAWQSLADAKRIWWGTLRANGTQHMERWSFQCLGGESWMGGNLAVGNFEQGLRALPLMPPLVDDGQVGEVLLRADLLVRRLDDPDTVEHAYLEQYTNDTYLVGASSYDEIADALNLFLDDVKADISNGLAYDKNGNDLRFSKVYGNDGVVVTWRRGQTKPDQGDPYIDAGDSARFVAYLRIGMHERAWRVLGYDVRLQNGDRNPVDNVEQYGQFSPGLIPGYWDGEFYSASPRAMAAFESGDFQGGGLTEEDYSSGGFDRRWPPLYPSGTATWTGESGQEFQLISPDPVLLAGSASRPVPADPDDSSTPFVLGGGVGEVNNQGILVVEGPYRRRGDEDQVDPANGFAFPLEREREEGRTVQVIRAGWRELPDGAIATDTDGWPRLVVYEWTNPKIYGFDWTKIDGTWGGFRLPPPGAEPMRARPLAVWDYTREGDKVSSVLRRVLLSTGTSGGWFEDPGFVTPIYGLGAGEAYLERGVNDDGGVVPGDAEIAGLGLGIPAELVAPASAWAAMDPVVGPDLARAKVTVFGVASASQMITRMLAPLGFAIGYSGGRFTPFDAWAIPTPDDAALVVTQELYAGQPGADAGTVIPRQRLRLWAPVDKIEISGRVEPLEGSYAVQLERRASDFGARGRAQQVVHKVNGDYLLDPQVPAAGADWLKDLIVRWRACFAFWSADQTIVPLSLHMADAVDLWPGDGVLVTDPWLLSSAGVYGVSIAPGRVLKRDASPVNEMIKFDVLLAAQNDHLQYAPSALVTRYDEQELGPDYRLLCVDDSFGDRDGSLDVDGFAEPSWSTEGGFADIEVWSFDDVDMVGGTFGQVVSVESTPGGAALVLAGPLTGRAWLPDEHHIVVFRRYADQSAAWVKRWHAPLSAKDGTHSGGVAGKRWRGL